MTPLRQRMLEGMQIRHLSPHTQRAYLARYPHRVAIANSRPVAMTPEPVTFHYRASRQHDPRKLLTLPHEEFLRRSLLHV